MTFGGILKNSAGDSSDCCWVCILLLWTWVKNQEQLVSLHVPKTENQKREWKRFKFVSLSPIIITDCNTSGSKSDLQSMGSKIPNEGNIHLPAYFFSCSFLPSIDWYLPLPSFSRALSKFLFSRDPKINHTGKHKGECTLPYLIYQMSISWNNHKSGKPFLGNYIFNPRCGRHFHSSCQSQEFDIKQEFLCY